jgi:hypothetical protein
MMRRTWLAVAGFFHVRWNFVKGWTHTPNIRSTNSRMDTVWLDLPELPHSR